MTEIVGRHVTGRNREQKYVMTQASTGVAGTKNWDVRGTKHASVKDTPMKYFNRGNGGVSMSQSQNTPMQKWNKWIVSARVYLWAWSFWMLSLIVRDLSIRAQPAIAAMEIS
jgi:hypothetical protein